MKFFALAVLTLAFAATSAQANCRDKRKAKHSARMELRECMEAWHKTDNPKNPEPTDECGSKLSAFVAASKDMRACRVDEKKAREDKKASKKDEKKEEPKEE